MAMTTRRVLPAGNDAALAWLAGLTVLLIALVAASEMGLVDRTFAFAFTGVIELLLFVAWGLTAANVARRRHGWERVAWTLFALSLPLTLISFTVLAFTGNATSLTATGDPAEAAVSLLLYGDLFAGLLVLGLAQSQSRVAWRRAIDGAIIAGAVFFILWGTLYRHAFQASSLDLVARASVVAYPMLDAMLLTVAALALAVPDPTRPRGYEFILLGLVIIFAGDVVATWYLLDGAAPASTWTVVTGMGGIGCLTLGAIRVGEGRSWARHGPVRDPVWVRLLPLFAVVPAMAVAVRETLVNGHLAPTESWTAAVVIALVLVQLSLTVAEAHRLEARLRQQSAYKTQLLRLLSHEIANPLSAIGLQVSLLRPPGGHRQWDLVERAVARLGSLSRDVRELALAETERLVSRVESTDLGPQVAVAVDAARAAATAKGLTLAFEPAGGEAVVRMDRQRIGQVLDNLLSNAVKYTKQGGIVVGVRVAGEHARVEVRDSGEGLEEAQRQALFQPFARVHKGREQGLGLGLYLCRSILAELHGRIGVDSPGAGQGSTFWFELPLDRADGRGLPALGDAAPDPTPG